MPTRWNSPAGYKSTRFGEAKSDPKDNGTEASAAMRWIAPSVPLAVMVFPAQTPDASGTLVCIIQPYGPRFRASRLRRMAARARWVVYSKIR
jgi:hypothetical protein